MADSNYNLNINIPVSTPQLDAAIKKLERMEKLRKGLEKEVDLVPDNAIKELTDLLKATEKNTTAIKKQKRAIDERTKVQQQLTQSRTLEAKAIAQLREQLRLQNKANRDEAKSKLETVSAYDRLSKTLLINQKRVKDLLAENRKLTKQEKELIKTTQRLDTRIKKIDKTIGDSRRNVGNYSSAWGRLGGSLRNVAQAAGLAVGIFGAFRIIKDSITIVRDFEKENAVLAGVLNTTSDGVKELTEDSIRLGSITAKTATQVTGLQIAFSRLGFTQEEILQLTEPTIAGSIALNAGLTETANLVGAVVNTFDDFSAADTPEILDVLTASTQRSALEFDKLQTALPIVGGAANAAGIPFNRLVALLGKLADSGIDASRSSTALRNIFIESASQGLDYEQIIQKIKDSQDKLTASTDEFGKRAAVSATILAKNIDAVDELEVALDNAGGTAERVAEVQLDTLDGAILLLTSAWEGFILNLNSGSSVISGPLTSAIRFLSSNLRTIIGVISGAIAVFLAYKVAIIAANVATRVLSVSKTVLSTVFGVLTGKIKTATISMRIFNKVSKANVFGIIIALATAAAVAMGLFGDETEEAKEKQEDFNAELAKTNRALANIDEVIGGASASADLTKRSLISLTGAIAKLRKEIEETGATDLTLLAIEGETPEQLAARRIRALANLQKANLRLIDVIQSEIDRRGEQDKSVTSLIEKQKVLLKQAKALPETTEAELVIKNQLIQTINKEIKRLRALGIEKEKGDKAQKIRNEKLKDRVDREERAQKEVIKTAGEIGKDLEQLEIDRFKSEIKRIGLQGNDLQNLTDQQDDALEALEDIHSVKMLKIAKDKAAKEKAIKDKGDAEDKARDEEELQRRIAQADFIVQKIGEVQRARSDDELERIANEISAQDRLLDAQISRAERGLENTLELQQERAAKLEIARQEEQERQERRQKILAFYTLLSGYAKENPNTALSRAAKDIAIGEAIALAFGEEGGVIGDINTTTTLRRGDLSRKHKSGDRLIVASPKEGLINERQMNKIGGSKGFYELTRAIDNDIMFPPVPVFKESSTTDTNEITKRLKSIEQAIVNKPVSTTSINHLGDILTKRQEEGVLYIKKVISKKPSFRR